MALANVAWVLASNGSRVLVIDWDLEAPGLHRFFRPFLLDKTLSSPSSRGLIEFCRDFAIEAATPALPTFVAERVGSNGVINARASRPYEWYVDRADITRYAASLEWKFLKGTIDFVPAGQQGPGYTGLVNGFNWSNFYERLGGAMFLGAVREHIKGLYDYILIDSRTGVSDTAGICTVLLPDVLVVLFTLNNQSIDGAAGVALSALEQSRDVFRPKGVRVLPVPSRTDRYEKRKLDQRLRYARSRFGGYVSDDRYWAEVEIPYEPYYSYDERLATWEEESPAILSVLASYERLTSYITNGSVSKLVRPSDDERASVLAAFEEISEAEAGEAVEESLTAVPADSVRHWETFSLSEPEIRVYLSSTAQDLLPYRRVAADTLLRMATEFVAMESSGPLPGEPVAECERKARECDVVVCIVGHRYGFVPDKGMGSITRREVEAAKAAGRDVLVWILADDHPWTEKKEQDLLTDPSVLADPARVADVIAGVQGLNDFKAWLRASFVCDTFTTPDDLGRKIAVALSARARRQIKREAPAVETRGEIRIVHALQPAPHFHGREELVRDLGAWISDLTSPDRVWSLVAAGGTGKTAVVERVVADMRPGEANVLVWSFYEQPDTDAFLRECNRLYLGEDEGPAGGRLERLERGLRDGRPHLIILDGLERVQEDARGGRVRGELSAHSLKLLLRAMAAGLGRARALVTSRYPLVDLQDWTNRGYRDTSLDDLSPEAAVAVLRGWGVGGDDDALRAAAAQVGHHALSVAVLGSYLRSFAGGRIEAVQEFDLDAVSGDDPRAAKLARVLAYYAQRLPEEERELLARLSVFPRGVTIDLLGVLMDAGGEVAGLLLKAKPRLVALLGSLRARGLVFQYQSGEAVTWTAHPFLRERFRELLGVPAERVFDAVAQALGVGLDRSPDIKPSDQTTLDRYERLIEATRLAGREQEAFDLFWTGLGSYQHLGWVLGEYEQGYRILAAFSATGHPDDLGVTMAPRWRSLLADELSRFAKRLGRLAEARAIRRLDDSWRKSLGKPAETSIGLQNSSDLACALGRLGEARLLAAEALNEAEAARNDSEKRNSLVYRAIAAHALGGIASARTGFAAATEMEGETLYSLRGSQHARHHLDLGDLAAARALADHGLAKARTNSWNDEIPRFDALLARIALAEGGDPTPHLDGIRAWTSRTGDMELIIEAHLLAARHLLTRGDTQGALDEAETGLLHAVTCGYGLLRIELLVALARIRLAWPDPPKAIQAAREALDLAAHPDCGYAWGEADAAQAWGEAFFANGELALAQRAFTRALEVRRRIEHPGASETERWLARTV
jgi:tetratricopeptide (TPR) repeat protein/cellulose biosynthesis protein BcsQ